jgi:phosphoribosylformylglycinamidine (FGAM) synthase PurS component
MTTTPTSTIPRTTTSTLPPVGSLTPKERADETVHAANMEGLINGIMTLIPSIATVGLLVRNNASFAARTNWQSRTAMAIMPAMFVAALSSELKVSHHMRQMAGETQHGTATVHWAEQQLAIQQQAQQEGGETPTSTATATTTAQQLASLYQQSVASSGVCIVPQMYWYHHVANYTAQYPFRVLSAIAIPSVAYIFYGRTEQQHLQLSQKIMHTRVLGQFTTISLLLTVMGCKEYLDQNGRFISQQQADDRVAEMHQVRQQFLYKMELDKQNAAELKAALEQAHTEDLEDATNKKKTKKHHHPAKMESTKHTMTEATPPPTTVME